MDANRSNQAVFLPLIFISGILLCMHGYLVSFTRLMADDFCSMYYAERFGLLRSIWYWRLNWSGRYSAFAADWFFADVLGPSRLPLLMPLLLTVWLILTVIAAYLFLQKCAPQKNNKPAAIMAGSLLLFAVFTISPDIPQSFYWLNGMRSYALPLIAITIYAIFYQLWVDKLNTRAKLFLGGLAGFLLLFVSGGFSETFAVMQFFLVLFLIVLKLLPHSARRLDASMLVLLSALAGTVASLMVIITAPGNAIRQSELPPHPDLAGLITISIQGYRTYISGILVSSVQLAGLVGVLAAFFWLGGHYKEQFKGANWLLWVFLAAGFLLPFACIPPGVFGYSEPPPARTVIIPFFILIAFLSYACLLAGSVSRSPLILRGALILALLCVGFSSLAQTYSLYEQKDVYVNFARNWEVMDEQIRSARARGDETITIPANENWAKLNTLIDNPKFWVNVCFKQYYGISVLGPDPNVVQP